MPWREQRQSPDGELPDVTVYDDDAVDVLQGALGTDWFFANRSGGVALDILNGLRLPGREAGVVPGPARAVIARAGVSRRKPSLLPKASPGQSSLFSLLSHK